MRPIRAATDGANLGGQIFVLGNPFGMGHSVSRGHIAGLDWALSVADHQLGGLIQVQAPLYPGDSGAAVVNVHGNLLGIIRSGLAIPCTNSAGRSRSRRDVGAGARSFPNGRQRSWPEADTIAANVDRAERDNDFGFAISARDALWIADRLRASGRVDRAYLGVRLEGASDDSSIDALRHASPGKPMLANRQNEFATIAQGSPSHDHAAPRRGCAVGSSGWNACG